MVGPVEMVCIAPLRWPFLSDTVVLTALPSFVSLDSNAKGGKRKEKTIDKLAAPGLCLLLIRAEGFLGHAQIRFTKILVMFALGSVEQKQPTNWNMTTSDWHFV